MTSYQGSPVIRQRLVVCCYFSEKLKLAQLCFSWPFCSIFATIFRFLDIFPIPLHFFCKWFFTVRHRLSDRDYNARTQALQVNIQQRYGSWEYSFWSVPGFEIHEGDRFIGKLLNILDFVDKCHMTGLCLECQFTFLLPYLSTASLICNPGFDMTFNSMNAFW